MLIVLVVGDHIIVHDAAGIRPPNNKFFYAKKYKKYKKNDVADLQRLTLLKTIIFYITNTLNSESNIVQVMS